MSHFASYSEDNVSDRSKIYQLANTASASHMADDDVKDENDLTIFNLSRPLGLRSVRWWLMEILASIVSVISFLGIVVVVIHYRGPGIENTHLPLQLTLNGMVAILSTICRVALMIPVASVISQEVWTWLYKSDEKSFNHRQLRDLEISDEASRSAWGSFRFVLQMRRK